MEPSHKIPETEQEGDEGERCTAEPCSKEWGDQGQGEQKDGGEPSSIFRLTNALVRYTSYIGTRR